MLLPTFHFFSILYLSFLDSHLQTIHQIQDPEISFHDILLHFLTWTYRDTLFNGRTRVQYWPTLSIIHLVGTCCWTGVCRDKYNNKAHLYNNKTFYRWKFSHSFIIYFFWNTFYTVVKKCVECICNMSICLIALLLLCNKHIKMIVCKTLNEILMMCRWIYKSHIFTHNTWNRQKFFFLRQNK